jgi:hypothetical protein
VLADQFENVAMLLREIDTDAIWNATYDRERKLLVNEIIEAVIVYPAHPTVANQRGTPANGRLQRGRPAGTLRYKT